MEQAIAYATSALALDERVLEAHMALSNVNLYYRWNAAEAERQCRRLIELSPLAPVGYHFLGWHLSLMGRFDEALQPLQHARALDPRSLTIRGAMLANRLWARDLAAATAEAEGILEFDPGNGFAIDGLANLRQLQGRFDEAIDLLGQAPIPEVLRLGALGHAYARARRPQEARQVMAPLQNAEAERGYDASFALGEIHAALQEADLAFACLDRAVQNRSPLIAWTTVEPRLDAVRGHARFEGLLRRIGFVAAIDNGSG
jgi:tetratricopeptide (TPR) repeat protein